VKVLSFEGNGSVSVSVSDILNSPKVRSQVEAVKELEKRIALARDMDALRVALRATDVSVGSESSQARSEN
jgi:hypothetical protein